MIIYIHMVLSLLKKEFLALLKDKSSRAVLLVPTVVQAMLFGYVATFDITVVNYVFEDRCGSEEVRDLKAQIDGSGFFKEIVVNGDHEKAVDLINTQDALMIIGVDANFAKNLHAGKNAALQVITDGRNSTTAATASAYLNSIVQRFNAEQSNLNGAVLNINYRALYNENAITRWNIVPALIATLSFIQVIMLASLSVAREREKGTFEQLLVTPLSATQLIIGKAVPPIIIGVVLSSVILLFALFWFNIPMQGSFLSLYIGLIAFCTACVGLGLAVSAVSDNMQQAMLYAFVLMVPLVLLSGLMSPIANMPQAWQYATYINPLRYAIDMCRRIYLEGTPLADLAYDLIPMLAIAAVTLPFASWLFRNHMN